MTAVVAREVSLISHLDSHGSSWVVIDGLSEHSECATLLSRSAVRPGRQTNDLDTPRVTSNLCGVEHMQQHHISVNSRVLIIRRDHHR